MTRRRDALENPCPLTRAIDAFGDSWCLLILREAIGGSTRFETFKADLDVSSSVLSRRLAHLVAAGLLVRVPYCGVGRTRHEYHLTRAGANALGVLDAFVQWGRAHSTPHRPPRSRTGVAGVHGLGGAGVLVGQEEPGPGAESDHGTLVGSRSPGTAGAPTGRYD
jgi:Predicted transcriptional regulators